MQQTIDTFTYRFIGNIIPVWIKPNHLTYLRFCVIPFLGLFLYKNELVVAFILLVIGLATDLFDGVLARKRHQVSDLGKILDPIADKLLVSVVLIYLGVQYLIVKIFLLIIFFELIANIFGKYFSRSLNIPIGANNYGKAKMLFQSIAIAIFLYGALVKSEFLVDISAYFLYVALFFAILSGFKQFARSLTK